MAPLLTRLSQSFGFGASTGGETNTGLTASGGTTSTYTDSGKTYKVHVFTSSGAFTVSAAAVGYAQEVDFFLVGGGGVGSFGGGGAGGVTGNTPAFPSPRRSGPQAVTTSPGSYTVTIGAGGASAGQQGANTDFGPRATYGGGCGGGPNGNSGNAGEGASGGGGGHGPGIRGGTSTNATMGHAGGTGNNPTASDWGGGGGGGGGSAGGDAQKPGTGNQSGGNGGKGFKCMIAGPTNTTVGTTAPEPGRWFAGGGGGCYRNNDPGRGGGGTADGESGSLGAGPYAGGGTGSGDPGNSPAGTPGTANTGGGGGGGNGSYYDGGSGLVIVRYQTAGPAQGSKFFNLIVLLMGG